MAAFLTAQQLDSIPTELVQQWKRVHADHKIAVEAASLQDSIPPTFAEWATSAGFSGVELRHLYERICSAHFNNLPSLTVHEINKLKQRWGLSEWDLYFELGVELMGSRKSITSLLALGKHYQGEESRQKTMQAVHEQRVLRRRTKSRTTKKDVSALVPADAIKAAEAISGKNKKIEVVVSGMDGRGGGGQTTKAKSSQTTKTAMGFAIPKPAEPEIVQRRVEVQIPASRPARRMSSRQMKNPPTNPPGPIRTTERTRTNENVPAAEVSKGSLPHAKQSDEANEDIQLESQKAALMKEQQQDILPIPRGEEGPIEVFDEMEWINPRVPIPEDTIRVEHPTDMAEESIYACPKPSMADPGSQVLYKSSASKPERDKPTEQRANEADTLKTNDSPAKHEVKASKNGIPLLPTKEDIIEVGPGPLLKLMPVDTTPSSPFEYQIKTRNHISPNKSKLQNLADVASALPTVVKTPPSNRLIHFSSASPKKSLLSSGIQAGEVPETPPNNKIADLPGSIELGSPSFNRSRLPEPQSPSIRLQRNKTQSHMKTKQTPDQGVYNSVMRRDFNATLRDNGGSICHKDLLGLDPEELVNDEIIKVYTAHLLKGHQSSEIFVANTFLYERIVTWRGKDDEDASVTIPKIKIHQKWVSIFDQKYFVVPVHQNGNHWKLAILVNMPSMLESDPNDVPTIFTVDSMDSKGNESNQDLVNTLKEYVCKSAILSKCDAERRDIEWVHATSATQQENEYDCGIFTLMYLEMFIRNPTEFLRKVEKKQRIETPDATVTRRMIKDTLCKLVYNTLQAKELSVDDETSDDDEILELPLHAREEMKTTIPFLKQSPIHQLREATEEEQKVLSKQPSPSSFGLLGNQSEALHLAPLPLGMDGNQDAAPGSQPQPPNAVLACQDDPQRPEASATPTIPPRKRKRSSSIPRSRPRLTPCYTPSTIEDTEVYTQSVTSLKQQFELLFEKLCSQQTSATEALATLRQEKADSPAKIRQIEAKIATETEERSLSLAPYDFLNRKKRIRTLRADEYDELARLEKTLELSFLKILALQDEKADVIGRDVYVDELIVQEESRLEMLERDIAKIEKVKGLAREMTDVWSGVGGGGDWV